MATWRQYDGLESAGARAGGETADFLSRLVEISPDLEPHRAAVMEAAQVLTDRMRSARYAAQEIVIKERGFRR
jgi:hypothetical protein